MGTKHKLIRFYINKFNDIPDEQWFTGEFVNSITKQKCVLGHCGVRLRKGIQLPIYTREARLFMRLCAQYDVAPITCNDNEEPSDPRYYGNGPKERVLNMLNWMLQEATK